MDKKNLEQVSFNDACRFIIKLGLAAHNYGSTTDQLQTFVADPTATLGYRGSFHSIPNEMVFAFQEKQDQWQQLHLETRPAPFIPRCWFDHIYPPW